MKSFYSLSNLVASNVIKCFDANNLVLNVDKINIMKFINKEFTMSCITYWSCPAVRIGHEETYYEETVNTKFLGLQIDNHINWKNHTLCSLNRVS